jgi:hypothetical protein
VLWARDRTESSTAAGRPGSASACDARAAPQGASFPAARRAFMGLKWRTGSADGGGRLDPGDG